VSFHLAKLPYLADAVTRVIVERPIRHFEVVSDVINSWDKDKSVNLLVAKKTPLANLLHPSVRFISRVS
jgi:hypothetical protein